MKRLGLSLKLLAVVAVCFSMTATMGGEADVNLAVNGGFEDGLKGWENRPIRGGPLTESTPDATEKHSGKFSLCVQGNGEKAGVLQEVKDAPPCQIIMVRYWGKIEKSPEVAGDRLSIGVDLGITLDDGDTDWFLPASLRLGAQDVGKWVHKLSWYRVPEGRTVNSLTIHCINYGNSGPVWFDDVEVVPVRLERKLSDICIALPITDRGERNLELLKERLKSGRRKVSMIPPVTPLRDCKLLVLSEFPNEEGSYRWVRDYFYAHEGRVIAFGFEDNPFSDGIRRFIWNEARPKSVVTTPDGRAVYYPSAEDLPRDMERIIRSALAAKEDLPATIEAASFPTRTVQVKDACLMVDGRPSFVRAMGAYGVGEREDYERDLAVYRGMGLNGVAAYVPPDMPEEDFVRFLDTVERNGLMAIVWFRVPRSVPESGGIPWQSEWLLPFLKYRNHPALLSWLMSDDTADEHFPVVKKIHDLIKRYDKDNLTTATSFGFRYPDQIAPERWAEWKKVMDYPTTYDYPLNKENKCFRANLCVGLEDIQKLCENVHDVYKGDAYFHLWAQSHLQGHVQSALNLVGTEAFLASPEQTRLLTFMMISAGARGILYFHARAFSDMYLGTGRRNELALVWHELAPFEALIAGGKRDKAVSVSTPDVEAVTFSKDGEALLLLIKHGKEYHRYVADGKVDDLIVKVRLKNARAMKTWRVGYPDVAQIEAKAEGADLLLVRVGDFDLTGIVYLGADGTRIEAISKQRKETLPAAAEWAYGVCRDKKMKTEVVLEKVAASGGNVPDDVKGLLAGANSRFAEARADLARKNFATSCGEFRSLLESYREIQKRMVLGAELIWNERRAPASAEKFLNMYFTLPSFYSVLNAGQPLAKGELGQAIMEQAEKE